MSKFKVGDKIRAVHKYTSAFGNNIIVGDVYTVTKTMPTGVCLEERHNAGWYEDEWFEPATTTIWDDLKDMLPRPKYDELAAKHGGPARTEDVWTITFEIPLAYKEQPVMNTEAVQSAIRDRYNTRALVTSIEKTTREVK